MIPASAEERIKNSVDEKIYVRISNYLEIIFYSNKCFVYVFISIVTRVDDTKLDSR